jgi:hypothetical protein
LVDESPFEETTEPRSQRRRIVELEAMRELDGGEPFGLCEQSEDDALALRELVALVRLGQQPNDARLHEPTRHNDVYGVGAFRDGRRRSTAREEPLEHQVDAATFALHELQIMEDAREPVVAATARVQDVLGRHSEREAAGIHDLEPIGMEIQVVGDPEER